MKTIVLVLTAIILASACRANEVQAGETAEPHEAWKANYGALEDENLKSLLKSAHKLLSATRKLPDEVELYSGEKKGGREEEAESEGEKGWVKLVDPPAVSLDRFARACEKAGRYEQAAELYMKLIEKHPGGRHYQKMWFICRRIAGAKLEDITSEMDERGLDKPEKSWLEWSKKVDQLSISLEEGGK